MEPCGDAPSRNAACLWKKPAARSPSFADDSQRYLTVHKVDKPLAAIAPSKSVVQTESNRFQLQLVDVQMPLFFVDAGRDDVTPRPPTRIN